MVAVRRLSGVWKGRLIDALGFEGELELNLKSDREGRLKGSFSVEIGAGHSTLRHSGKVEGKVSKSRLRLAFADKERAAKINLTGDLLDLRDGGVGLNATYEVSSRYFSPLQGGIASLSKDRKVESDIITRSQKD